MSASTEISQHWRSAARVIMRLADETAVRAFRAALNWPYVFRLGLKNVSAT